MREIYDIKYQLKINTSVGGKIKYLLRLSKTIILDCYVIVILFFVLLGIVLNRVFGDICHR